MYVFSSLRVKYQTLNQKTDIEIMTEPQATDSPETPHFSIRGQYIKDLSFENPGAPASLMPAESKPGLEVNVDIAAQQVGPDIYEVTLHVTAKALRDSQSLFLTELTYGGIFALQNLSSTQREAMLFIEAPHILFPFARRIIGDATRDGGFPPLMLDPIDFHRLYVQRKAQEQQQEPQQASA